MYQNSSLPIQIQMALPYMWFQNLSASKSTPNCLFKYPILGFLKNHMSLHIYRITGYFELSNGHYSLKDLSKFFPSSNHYYDCRQMTSNFFFLKKTFLECSKIVLNGFLTNLWISSWFHLNTYYLVHSNFANSKFDLKLLEIALVYFLVHHRKLRS